MVSAVGVEEGGVQCEDEGVYTVRVRAGVYVCVGEG